MRINKITAILASLALLTIGCLPTGCAPVARVETPPAQPQQTPAPAAPAQTAPAVDALPPTISLEENPTTGYVWSYKLADESLVKCVTDIYVMDYAASEQLNGTSATGTPAVGGGGTHMWRFEGVKAGTTEAVFSYARAWEQAPIEQKTYVITVAADLTVSAVEKPVASPAPAPETALISLEENPTTGYTWAFTAAPEGIIELASDEYAQDETAEPMVGVGGTHKWTFKGVSAGTATVTFIYAQQWDASSAVKKAECTITVDDKLNASASAPAITDIEQPNPNDMLPAELQDGFMLNNLAFALKNTDNIEQTAEFDANFVWCVLYYDVLNRAQFEQNGIVYSEKYNGSFFIEADELKNVYYQTFSTGALPEKIAEEPFFGMITQADGGYYFSVSDKGDNDVKWVPTASQRLVTGELITTGYIMYFDTESENGDYIPFSEGAFLLRDKADALYGFTFDSYTSMDDIPRE